jgi:putative membrane protein
MVEEYYMAHPYWNDWYFGWLAFGIWYYFPFELRQLGLYLQRAWKADQLSGKDALDILNARYARGEITREQLALMRSEIAKP